MASAVKEKAAKPNAKATTRAKRSQGDAKARESLELAISEERVVAARESQQALASAITDRADSPPSLAQMEALVDGAAPDDAARMRRTLGLPKPPGKPRKTSNQLADDWRDGGYPYKYKMLRKDYEREKFVLQTELLKLQKWVRDARQRVVILFEGRDAAGKGGTIKRFMEHINPRGARVVALEKPSE